MFEIDKAEFGAFLSQLRKEKGYTQKDLAGKLFVSDKAVSKWETGASIPDTALLVPICEILEITTTELLTCQRMGQGQTMDAAQVDSIVKQTITLTASEQTTASKHKRKWMILYTVFFAIACAEMLLLYFSDSFQATSITVSVLGTIFGAYFCLFAKPRLPTYYDENKVSAFVDGPFRMNMPGVNFNNSNWPHIMNAGRVWALATMAGYPALCFVMQMIFPRFWAYFEIFFALTLCLGGLFVPMYILARKYE